MALEALGMVGLLVVFGSMLAGFGLLGWARERHGGWDEELRKATARCEGRWRWQRWTMQKGKRGERD